MTLADVLGDRVSAGRQGVEDAITSVQGRYPLARRGAAAPG